MTLLVQIIGGLFGIAIAYAMHRVAEKPYERSTEEARIKFEAEMEKLRKKTTTVKK
jgi:hypothetical protein